MYPPTLQAAYERALNSFPPSAEIHPIVRLTDGGPDYGKPPGPDDDIGYGMNPNGTGDDCLRAAIATALQHPIERVPDLRLDEQLLAGDDPLDVSLASW